MNSQTLGPINPVPAKEAAVEKRGTSNSELASAGIVIGPAPTRSLGLIQGGGGKGPLAGEVAKAVREQFWKKA
jgi:hypothetical protein